jgi:threonine/homoserine/homoserine lactone efflux protein
MLPDTDMLIVFLLATIALNLSPGPDMLYVVSRSLERGRRAGVVSALGIGVGTLVHTFLTAVGLSAVMISIPVAFQLIRYAGATYLAYLGLRVLFGNRTGTDNLAQRQDQHSTLWIVFRQGVLTNVLNPKVALFFLAFLPQFVDTARGAIAVQIVLLGLIFDTSGTSWNILIAAIAAHARAFLAARSGFSLVQKMLPGVILLALAALVVLR